MHFLELFKKQNRPFKMEYWLLLFLYRCVLDIAYGKIISPLFSHMGFYNHAGFLSMGISWLLLFIFAWISKNMYENQESKFSCEIVFMLVLISAVPFTTLVGYKVLESSYIAANFIYWLFLLLFSQTLCGDKPARINSTGKNKISGDLLIHVIACVSFGIVVYVSWKYTHFRLNFSLSNVYDLRAEAKNYSFPVFLKYLFSWTRMINPIIISFYIRRKKWFPVVIGIFVQFLSFGIDGSKTTLFLTLAAVGFSFLPQLSFTEINKWILRGVTAILVFSIFLYAACGILMPISMLTRRMMFLPVQLGGFYWDFFTTHVPDYFRQSFLRHFGVLSPYPPLPYMIGDLYLHEMTSSNNGLISDAIANLGYAGIVLFPLMLSLVFLLLDRSTKSLDRRICITVVLYLSVVLTNSFLFTVLLTHGLIVIILLLSLMNRNDYREQQLSQTKGTEK